MPQTRVQSSKLVLPTPIKVEKLNPLLAKYDTVEADFLVKGFTEGFPLGSTQTSTNIIIPKNHASALRNSNIVLNKINKEISLGRYMGPFDYPPLPNFVSSPLGLVPKKEQGKFRVIHDLSFPKSDSVNMHILPESSSVSYQNIETVIKLVQKNKHNCLMAKADIEDAFRLIPIYPADHHLLGFTWNQKYFYDTCLPMGCSSSCQIFERFSSAIQWLMTYHYKVNDISHLLDDFFFIGPQHSELCSSALKKLLRLMCRNWGTNKT